MTRLFKGILAACVFILASATGHAAETSHPRDRLPLLGKKQMLPQPAFGDLAEIRRRKVIRILVPYSRTNFFFERGVPRGFAYDMFQEYGKVLNARVKPRDRVAVAFIPVPRDKLIAWLQEGRGDVAAGRLTVTPERQALVDFAAPIETDVAEIPVTHKDGVQIRRLEDLSGRTVHVRPSSSYHASLLALNETLAARSLPPARIVPVEDFLEDEDLLEKLHERLIDTIIVDAYKHRLFDDIFPDLVFNLDVRLRDGADIAWAIRKDSPDLKASLSDFVAQAQKGQHVLQIVERRYFVDNRWICKPPKAEEMARFAAVRGYFETYAPRYGLDWSRLLAQGFQESGLDHSVKSPVGAIGLMQLMPQTAAGAPILLPDIHVAEMNVQAGAKYMRHLMDTYFGDPGLDPAERFRLALASYNAGPNRVATLRKRTMAAGLDPNVWYGNVELLAARHVGQETVTYVSNIEKYLFAFRNTLALEALREGTPP
jgi:membrane-bound lytic murein transglycosylase MltF